MRQFIVLCVWCMFFVKVWCDAFSRFSQGSGSGVAGLLARTLDCGGGKAGKEEFKEDVIGNVSLWMLMRYQKRWARNFNDPFARISPDHPTESCKLHAKYLNNEKKKNLNSETFKVIINFWVAMLLRCHLVSCGWNHNFLPSSSTSCFFLYISVSTQRKRI